MISLNCRSELSYSLLSFFKTAILNSLSTRSQNSMTLSLVIGELLSFNDDMVPWFFMFLVVLCCCCCIWSSRHLLKSLLVVFKWGILFVGIVINSAFFWVPLFHSACSLLWQTFKTFISFLVLTTHQTGHWLLCFREGDATAQVSGFSFAHRPWPFLWSHALSTGACFCCCTQESRTRCWLQSGGKCELLS